MGLFKNRSLRKEILLKIQNAEKRIESMKQVWTALRVRSDDTSIFIVSTSPENGIYAAELSDIVITRIKGYVIEDIERKIISDTDEIKHSLKTYDLLKTKKPTI